MNLLVLRLKHWQVFPFLLIGGIMAGIEWQPDSGMVTLVHMLGFIIIYGWILWMGRAIASLNKEVPVGSDFFTFNGILLIAVYSIALIVGGTSGFQVEGIIAIPFFYLFYAIIYIYRFPMKALRTMELGREATWKDYGGLFWLLLFSPIGIWFIQPRLNKLMREKYAST